MAEKRVRFEATGEISYQEHQWESFRLNLNDVVHAYVACIVACTDLRMCTESIWKCLAFPRTRDRERERERESENGMQEKRTIKEDDERRCRACM